MLVSRAMAVVIVRVYPRMFPPSIIATPTSETTRPNPAITAARMPNRISPTSAAAARSRPAPSVKAVGTIRTSAPRADAIA